MNKNKSILVALMTALAPLVGWCAADVASNPAPPPPPAAVDMSPKLSRPAKDVVKMVTSGVPDDVVKAYINNNPSTYDLTSDNIIHMQGVGVSGAVTGEMLAHDKKVRDQAAAAQLPPLAPPQTQSPESYAASEPQPESQPANSVSVYTIPSDNSYYSDLTPYGSWCLLPSYGWCWQPRLGLGYGYYPWGILRSGRWWNCPGRGWVWFPGSHFRDGFGVHGFANSRGFEHTHGFVNSRGFGTARGFAGGLNHFGNGGGSFVANRSMGNFHSSVSTHTINGGFGHSSGFAHSGGISHSGGGHWGGGGMSHSSGGHSFGGRGGGGHR